MIIFILRSSLCHHHNHSRYFHFPYQLHNSIIFIFSVIINIIFIAIRSCSSNLMCPNFFLYSMQMSLKWHNTLLKFLTIEAIHAHTLGLCNGKNCINLSQFKQKMILLISMKWSCKIQKRKIS